MTKTPQGLMKRTIDDVNEDRSVIDNLNENRSVMDDIQPPEGFPSGLDFNCQRLENIELYYRCVRQKKESDNKEGKQNLIHMIKNGENGSFENVERLKDILKKLDRSFIDIKDPEYGYTALINAVVHAKTENGLKSVELLLEYGSDINAKDPGGWSPLHFAALNTNDSSSLETVKLLLENGADINAKNDSGKTPLHLAAENSDESSSLETVKLLLDLGADVNTKDGDELTPLHFAARNSNNTSSLETVKLLLDRGAYVNAKSGVERSPLHIAATFSASESSVETVKLLLDYGADVNAKDGSGDTPLHDAVQNLAIYTVKLLLNQPNILLLKNNEGETAFDFCTTEKCKNLFRGKSLPAVYSRNPDDNKLKSTRLVKDIQDDYIVPKLNLDCSTEIAVNRFATDILKIDTQDPIWSSASLAKKCWLANKMIYYKGRSDKLNYVNRLYESAVKQSHLNQAFSGMNVDEAIVKKAQDLIHRWKYE